jgi:predicted glycosyltransferase involved in capsule biosynthesis
MKLLLNWLKRLIHCWFHKKGHGISLLVPYKKNIDPRRDITWEWLKKYWKHELPGAEIIVSSDHSKHGHSFSKTTAVNNAANQANGDIFVILDADCFISGDVILECAEKIREARKFGDPLWFVPYRNFYRLNQETSLYILMSDPKDPMRMKTPPDKNTLVPSERNDSSHGHSYGAMIQMLPREAFELVKGMDARFNGWGGEDVSFLRAVDTLYCHHKTSNNDVYHLWHPTFGSSANQRTWSGQKSAGTNSDLSSRYNHAFNDRAKMQAIIDEVDKPNK